MYFLDLIGIFGFSGFRKSSGGTAGTSPSTILNINTSLNLNLNSLLVKRQIDNPSPGAVTGGN